MDIALITVVETAEFISAARKLMKDDERMELLAILPETRFAAT